MGEKWAYRGGNGGEGGEMEVNGVDLGFEKGGLEMGSHLGGHVELQDVSLGVPTQHHPTSSPPSPPSPSGTPGLG